MDQLYWPERSAPHRARRRAKRLLVSRRRRLTELRLSPGRGRLTTHGCSPAWGPPSQRRSPRMDRLGHTRWTVAVLCFSGIVGLHARIAASQSIAITGQVVDAVSGHAVAGVQVTVGSRTVVTDADGR